MNNRDLTPGKRNRCSWLFAVLILICMALSIAGAGAGSAVQVRPKTSKAHPNSGLLVTFDVAGERFKAVVTKTESVEYVLSFVAGGAAQKVPNGLIRLGGSHNSPYSWYLEPDSVEFVDQAMEYCDGKPSYAENNIDEWIRTVGRYCPSNARIVNVKDCRSGQCKKLSGLYSGRAPF